ncbi:MAG: hypothetical protein MJY47_01615 [Fibrobacter sp.]|nr:hypothetical protein [Fibrobacter sp.]
MKKCSFVLSLLIAATFAFAGEKCNAYSETFSAQLLLQIMEGNVQNRNSLYPMLYVCFWEGFVGSLENHYSGWSDDLYKKMHEVGFPTKKGMKLFEAIFEGSVNTVEEFIRSGEFSATGVTPCLLSDDMLDEMGSQLWNSFKNTAVKEGVSRRWLRFAYLDRNVCKAWGSRKVTEEDLR